MYLKTDLGQKSLDETNYKIVRADDENNEIMNGSLSWFNEEMLTNFMALFDYFKARYNLI